MKFFYEVAEGVKDENGWFGKGPGWIAIMTLGLLCSSYLLGGYAIKMLSVVKHPFWLWIKNFSFTAVDWLILILVICLIAWLVIRNKNANEAAEKTMADDIFDTGKTDELKKNRNKNVLRILYIW